MDYKTAVKEVLSYIEQNYGNILEQYRNEIDAIMTTAKNILSADAYNNYTNKWLMYFMKVRPSLYDESDAFKEVIYAITKGANVDDVINTYVTNINTEIANAAINLVSIKADEINAKEMEEYNKPKQSGLLSFIGL